MTKIGAVTAEKSSKTAFNSPKYKVVVVHPCYHHEFFTCYAHPKRPDRGYSPLISSMITIFVTALTFKVLTLKAPLNEQLTNVIISI